jgi:hypothetical protein
MAVSLVPDERPPAEGDVPTCVDCGVELVYAGTGRKPTKCDEHKKRRGAGGAKVAGPPGTNEKLAGQATDVLCQLNDWLAIGAMMAGLHGTAGELAERQERFREQAHAALLLDPTLARTILRGGAKSGKAALAMAYLTMLGSVAPTAVVEFKELRAARAAESDPAPDEGEAA